MIYTIIAIVGFIIVGIIYSSLVDHFSNHKKRRIENADLKNQLKKVITEFEEEKLSNHKNNLTFKDQNSKSTSTIIKLNKRIDELEIAIALKDDVFNSLKNKTDDSVAKFSTIYADQLLVQYEITARHLETKKHPAHVKASNIRQLKIEAKSHKKQFREMMYKYESLLQLFPELAIYVDDFETIQLLENFENLKDLKDDFDRVGYYVKKNESQGLSENERNQLALDRYVKGKKTNWQIGRDYELFCGREYELNGWNVEYIGMEKKLNDMGRDLIAKKDKTIHIIQCKYWAQHKEIHEKHITQLYGTTIAYGLDINQEYDIIPIFMTNIKLSKTAAKFAEKLNVKLINKDLKPFPRIKCNVGKDENGFKTKIYHLPFDQQYDKTKINNNDCFYAMTVNEAVRNGFRRAFKYYGA